MTQALNLANFANKLNSSGQTDNTGLQNNSIVINTTSPITGGATTALGSSLTIAHATSGVTAASYTNANITVNSQGHITSASNGAGLTGVFVQTFTSSGTFTVPTGVTAIRVTMIGSGGGGGGNGWPEGAGGGGGGGGAISYLTGLTPGSTISVTMGAGGTGVYGYYQSGNAGGTSSFGGYFSITGGGGGLSKNRNTGSPYPYGGAGGTVSGTYLFANSGFAGGNGGTGGCCGSINGGNGGNSQASAAGYLINGIGGTGGSPNGSAPSVPAGQYGAGGGGCGGWGGQSGSGRGADGTMGICIIEW